MWAGMISHNILIHMHMTLSFTLCFVTSDHPAQKCERIMCLFLHITWAHSNLAFSLPYSEDTVQVPNQLKDDTHKTASIVPYVTVERLHRIHSAIIQLTSSVIKLFCYVLCHLSAAQ